MSKPFSTDRVLKGWRVEDFGGSIYSAPTPTMNDKGLLSVRDVDLAGNPFDVAGVTANRVVVRWALYREIDVRVVYTPDCETANDLVAVARGEERVRATLDHKASMQPMLLHCPMCGERHIDEGEFATKPHHTHACQSCGMVWRPAIGATCGVRFLPGFKNSP